MPDEEGSPSPRSPPPGGAGRRTAPSSRSAPTAADRRSTWPRAGAPRRAAAATCDRRAVAVIFSVDHHRGSEENQAGWQHHDPSLVDPATGRMDTLPHVASAIATAGAEDLVVGLVGDSPRVARLVDAAGLVFIDGGHGEEPAWADYRGWAPHVVTGGWLAIHDVFADPADGRAAAVRASTAERSPRAASSRRPTPGWGSSGCCGGWRAASEVGRSGPVPSARR